MALANRKGFKAEPGERGLVAPLTCPSNSVSKNPAEPTKARRDRLSLSMTTAAALPIPWLRKALICAAICFSTIFWVRSPIVVAIRSEPGIRSAIQ
jgi:hypothetical protein